jgi:DedD protein
MGLFSFLSKNKQQTTGTDSGFYSADDEQAQARARAKRASSAGAPAARGKEALDPVLPEKKRARRRLVGAIALALGVAIGLPMILDSEPKPLASDIEIRIPSKDKPAAAGRAASASSSRVAASVSLDQSEEIVTMPAKPAAVAAALPAAGASPVKAEAALKTEARHEAKVAETKPAPREVKTVEARPADRHEAKAGDKPARPASEAVRALSILEGKPVPQEATGARYVVQVAALANQDKIDELQGKLKNAGIKFYAQKVPTPAGDRTRIRVGPFASREEAEKMRARLVKAGLNGTLVPA